MKDPKEPPKITGIGARLKSAREAMHLSEKEAAARLYLNVKIINILENEAFNDGPPATFIRGYLHSYARLLSFPDSEICAALKELEVNLPVNRDTTQVLRARPIDYTDRYLRWITLSIAAVLALLVLVWWSSHSKYDIVDVPTPITTEQPEKELKTTVDTSPPSPVKVNTTPTPIPPPPIPVVIPLRPGQEPLSNITNTNTPITNPPITNPIIPLAAPVDTTQNTPATTTYKKKLKHRTHSRKKNIVMSLPEPGD